MYSIGKEDTCISNISSVQRLFPSFKSLSNDKFLDWSKFKAFADKKIKKFFLGWLENIAGKGENAGKMLVTSIFSFSYNVFKGF